MTEGLHLQCDFCESPIQEPGGLLSIPIPGSKNEHLKQHLCLECSQKANQVLDLTSMGNGNAGFYWSPPIYPGLWHIHIKMLTLEELELLKAQLKDI